MTVNNIHPVASNSTPLKASNSNQKQLPSTTTIQKQQQNLFRRQFSNLSGKKLSKMTEKFSKRIRMGVSSLGKEVSFESLEIIRITDVAIW